MNSVRPAAPQLAQLEPYDPKYLPAQALLSANENPHDVDSEVRQEIMRALKQLPFNRYPDPLANDLRDLIAEANGLEREQVIVGNGGDELLFNIALAWGGPGRTFLNMPPTFSVYENNARLTNTAVANVPRTRDYTIDEEAVLVRVAQGDIDYVIVTSPNNPTGELASETFMLKLLDATDALVMVDEAYFEFSRRTMRPYLAQYKNLVILRTFSKAFSLAGVRMGYLLGDADIIREFTKVRQPYSVDAVSQAIARVVYANRAKFEPSITAIIEERARVIEGLRRIPGITPFPSDANYVLFHVDTTPVGGSAAASVVNLSGASRGATTGALAAPDAVQGAAAAWQALYDQGILIRDFSRAPMMEGCLRVSIGSSEENDAFLAALRDFMLAKR